MSGEPVRREIEVPGPAALWETRCEEEIARRPFKLAGPGARDDRGTAFPGEYRRLGVLVLVTVDVVRLDNNRTLLAIEATPQQDNPLRQFFRNPGEQAAGSLIRRLLRQ